MLKTPTISIQNRTIGACPPTFIIAEVSCNHLQDYEKAVALIKAAKEAGADAVKLQTYTPDTMTLNSNKKWFCNTPEDAPDSWKGVTLYDLYKTAYTPWEWQPKLKQVANDCGIMLFSTPFDETAVDFLEAMDVPCYKIASYEATHIPLLKKVARTGKPIIISIGFADLPEVDEAMSTLRNAGAQEIAVLHCTTNYSDRPAEESMNLRTITDIRQRFNVVSGFSDNNAGIEFPIASVLAGASIIEKHFILSRSDDGHDQRFSIEPAEFKKMVQEVRRAERILGQPHYGPVTQAEAAYKKYRRSIFVIKDIQAGECITQDNVRVIRPSYGLHPGEIDAVLGKKALTFIEQGTPLSWELIT